MDKEYIEEITITNAAANYPGIEVSAVRDYMTGALKPKTNADRIRSMSDEELAEFFGRQEYRRPTFDGWLPLCNHVMGPRTCHEDGCEKCWLDWLRQEVEEGE